jgi:hypothetical protein
MRRWIAVWWQASFVVLGGALYFFFVLPRWYELTGDWSHTLGTVMRIVAGALIGLAALPVVFTWLRTRKPEYGTPQLALSLRVGSIVSHVLAGVLIIGAAVSEIWLSLDSAGQWLFGIYGVAAAIAVLGSLAFYLAFLAELPPPPPKPLKPKSQTRRRKRGEAAEEEATDETADEAGSDDEATAASDETVDTEDAKEPEPSEPEEVEATAEPDEAEASEETPESAEITETSAVDEASAITETSAVDEAKEVGEPANADELDDDKGSDKESEGKLRNRRPAGKSLFRRSRGGVALDD